LYLKKRRIILFFKSTRFDHSKFKLIELTNNVMFTYYTLLLQYNFLDTLYKFSPLKFIQIFKTF